LQDNSYLHYSLFTFNLLLNHLCTSGLGDRYLWSLHPETWRFMLGWVSGTLVVWFMLQFTRSFLHTAETAPRLDRALWYVGLILGGILVAPLLSLPLNLIKNTIAPVITIFAFGLVLVTGIMVWWHNYRPARYFLLAWSLFILTVVLFFLRLLSILPNILFAIDLINLGSVMLVLTLSLALADRINLLQADTAQANQKLHESEYRFKQFLEALPVGVIVFQANKILSYMNERAFELFKLTPTANSNLSLAEALAITPFYVTQTDKPYPPEKMPILQAFHGQASYIDDIDVQLTNQQRRQLEVWSRPIFDTLGRVQYAMSVFQDITQRKQNEAELYHYQHRLEELVVARTAKLNLVNAELDRLAHVDGLTHIANRRRFDQYLAQAWRTMAQAQLPLSLILCDIDYFKLYNDTYGHQAGDDCLRQVAQAFTTAIKRSTDLAARYGGEEFVLVLPRTDEVGVKIVAGYLHERVQQLQIPHAASQCSQYITISLGVTTVIPTLDQSPDDLVTAADSALYQAKLQGRNCTVSQRVGE